MLLPAIVFSQFAGTSLWFAGNAVLGDLQLAGAGGARELQWITQAVQLGFICGTLVFALFAVADRASPRLVFLLSSLAGALANLAGAYVAWDVASLMIMRFCTGFFLAGIYPVGMKVAAGWYERGLGSALGLLVGALVLGTAFPHLLQALGSAGLLEATAAGGPERARIILGLVSLLAVVGGFALYILVPDGPFLQKREPAREHKSEYEDQQPRENISQANPFSHSVSATPALTSSAPTIFTIFRDGDFRRAALGYFGHMWELYAFWAFTPIFLAALFSKSAPGHAISVGDANISLWSFLIIAIGFFGCAIGGYISLRIGSARVAFSQLAISGGMCLLSPLLFWDVVPLPLALAGMLLWGFTVIGDSPQFSALVAATAPRELVGSALTIVNSIGFALTIVSIEVLGWWATTISNPAWLFVVLAPGPIAGLLALRGILRDSG
ncbi:MAG: MFS transporter [bacterium]|nr:MFS transporter [bacterium]